MFAGMLPAQPGVRVFVPIIQLAVELRMFPRALTLFVRLIVFFVELFVHIVMALIKPLVLLVVAILLMCRCRHREANQQRTTQNCHSQFSHQFPPQDKMTNTKTDLNPL
ncbi:hypothetical protein [Novosphingobium sp.]|uniref:hypothetical protein n=1 Tax=Novosphingobium sp. TaxID=1874826 RepID=UPI003341791C